MLSNGMETSAATSAREIVVNLLANGATKAEIAKAIGYDRSSVSRWINEPDYNGEHIEAAVLECYSRFICPHLKQEITPAACAAYAGRSCPTANTREVRHWKTCQTCPHKPTLEGATK